MENLSTIYWYGFLVVGAAGPETQSLQIPDLLAMELKAEIPDPGLIMAEMVERVQLKPQLLKMEKTEVLLAAAVEAAAVDRGQINFPVRVNLAMVVLVVTALL